ncbi:MAG: hypothetical protein HXY41_05415 [Chloroflexi bacterium]|nr:hypothetical protein [Chloroflexota bacterium]
MKKVLFLILIVSVLLPGWAAVAAPPEQANRPAVTTFTSTATVVDRAQLAQRTARVPVSWTTANRPSTANLVFEQVLADGRVVNVELPRDNPWVASAGNGVVAPFPPGGDATSVQFRLRLVDLLTQNTLDQRELTLPLGDAPGSKPAIRTFTAATSTVSRATLEARTARINVSWAVDNRPNNANLVFEEVLADGTAVNVELPRPNPIVASAGNGVVAPVPPGGTATSFKIRVRLIDLTTQNTLDQKEQTITIDDTPAPTPTIRVFNIGASSVSSQALQNRTARVPVSWAVENRPDNANLVFEQVLSDGRAVNVELPRPNPIIPSSGNGVVAPIPPGGTAKEVSLRVRLIDTRSNNVYATAEGKVAIVEGNTPAIVQFATTAQSADRQALVSRTARIPVSWEVINRPNTGNLVFEQVLEDGTVVNIELPRENPYVASSGTGVTAPVAPQKAETNTITLRLRLFDVANSTVYAERQISLPITTTPTGSFITTFSTTAASVEQLALENRTARIPVAWNVTNRPQNTNLVFEQILADGRVINVELPRPVPIVPSSGLGVVAPIVPGADSAVLRLQLRLINLSTFATLDSKEITVPITGAQTGEPPVIVSFSADPNPAPRGSTITLTWETTNATRVSVGMVSSLLAAAPEEKAGLTTTGSTTFTLPMDMTGQVTFGLSAFNATGQETRQEIIVSLVDMPAPEPTEEAAQPPVETTPEATAEGAAG